MTAISPELRPASRPEFLPPSPFRAAALSPAPERILKDRNSRVSVWRPVDLMQSEIIRGNFIEHRFAPHEHTNWTIGWVTDGTNEFRRERQNFKATAGTVCVVNPAEVHTGGGRLLGYWGLMPSPALLGVTFKENCADIRNSKAIDIITELQAYGVDVAIHDPWAQAADVRADYGLDLLNWDELPIADALVLAVSHDDFLTNSVEMLAGKLKPGAPVIDVKAALDAPALRARGFDVWRL